MNRNLSPRIMSGKKILLIGAAGLAGFAALTVWAITATNPPRRTTASLTGVAQRPLTQLAAIDVLPLNSAHLVNLALGRDVGNTNFPKQVLAFTVTCDLTTASLIIFDQSVSNTLATLATNLSFDFVQSPVVNSTAAQALGSTNQLIRFIARLQIQPSGNVSNALRGGVLTVAGRAHRDTATGCLAPVPVQFDTDPYDKTFQVKDVPRQKDRDKAKLTGRTGLAYVIGELDVVAGFVTNSVIIPTGNLSIRRSAEIIK